MRENGITWVKNTSKILHQIYWEQIALPINYIIFFFKFKVFKIQKRSNQSLITSSSKRVDTLGEIERIERGRDNMVEFVNTVPDECLIELSEKVYCNKPI